MRCCVKLARTVLLCWQTHKITFLLSLSNTKRQVSFSLLFSLLFFFFFPQPHTIVNSIRWLPWSTGLDWEDRTPPPLCAIYVEYCTGLNCVCGRRQDASTPFLFFDRKLSVSGVFPPVFFIYLSLPSFIFLSLFFNILCGVIALISESSDQKCPVEVQPVEQCTFF